MNRTRKTLVQALLAGTALSQPCLVRAVELPHGATTVYGGVAIGTPSANQMTIQQSTQTAIVNWQGFSVGAGGRVDIHQPSSSSAILNRVTGSATSTIAGQINANGQVYLVNPNGIAITPTGTVQAGAFVASTLDISDQDFASGKRVFRGTGQSATVSNQGTIAIQRGGYAALLGGKVENSGLISVPMGRVGLGAGEQATLDFSGDGFLQVAIPSKGDGSDKALIQHSGRISATGGQVVMQAATARDAARHAINLSGVVEARSISGRNGAIVLGGGEGGTVTVSGRLDTSARGASAGSRRTPTRTAARGGDIIITGDAIRLQGAALLADGQAGGGTIRVGGGFQGQGSLQRASTTSVDAATTISANAGRSGNGGDIVIWSDHRTDFAGQISATGGSTGGNGGQAEVSSKGVLAYDGTTILTAAHGSFGTLLLDPYNVTISNGADANQSGFAATGNDSVISAATLQNALRSANVTVTTGNGGTQAGDITVAAPLTWGTGTGSATTLTLSAYRSIIIGANLTVNGDGGLSLNTNQGGAGGAVSFGSAGTVSFVNGTSGGQNLQINGQVYTLVRNATDLGLALANPGSANGRYALAADFNAAGANPLLAPINSNPSTGADVPFTGTLNGLGHTINGLTVNSQTQYAGLFGTIQGGTVENLKLTNLTVRNQYAGTLDSYTGGLAGRTINSTISNVSVSGTVSSDGQNPSRGFSYTGGLIGENFGTVIRSSSAGSVQGGGAVEAETGGLIGRNGGTGTVTQSFSTANVTGATASGFSADTGGLIGWNTSSGSVSQVFASGSVTGGSSASGSSSSFTGGLIGYNTGSGSVQQAYATGPVQGGRVGRESATGGLVGNAAAGTINQTYAVGRVTGGSGTTVSTGGLIGDNASNVSASFWDTTSTGQTAASGNTTQLAGATGLTTADFQNASVFVPLATSQGWNFQTTWSPPQPGSYPQLYSLSGGTPTTSDQPTGPTQPTGQQFVEQGFTSARITPNIVSILPNLTLASLTLADSLDLAGGGGPTLGIGQGSSMGGSETRTGAQTALGSIQRASNTLEKKIAACDSKGSTSSRGTANCYSNALDGFADSLDIQLQQLPPAFRGLPAVIRQAAQQVRTARTVAEARAALAVAVVAVRKAISLLRADEPAVARIQVRQGNAIASALRTVDNRLSRAVGL